MNSRDLAQCYVGRDNFAPPPGRQPERNQAEQCQQEAEEREGTAGHDSDDIGHVTSLLLCDAFCCADR